MFWPTYAIHVRDDNAKPRPQIRSPACGGGLGWGLTRLARGPKLGQHARMRGGHTIISRSRHLRRSTTRAERLLWSGLRNDQLGWRFRRQHPIPPYIVDFACVEARLVVEADGGQHGRVGDHDVRDRALREGGWLILRFWNNDIVQNREGTLRVIATTLGPPVRKGPHPNPRPRAGEEMPNGG